jgi:hypothetical protein
MLPARFWALLPVFVILLAAIPNGILIYHAKLRKPASVETDTYEKSRNYDQEVAARTRFQERGLVLDARPEPGAIALSLEGASGRRMQDFSIALYRPDDPSQDRTLAWNDPAVAVQVPVSRAGNWQLTLRGQLDGELVLRRVRLMVPAAGAAHP